MQKKYTFNMEGVTSKLESFSESKRLAFGIFLLERSLPEFFQFQIDSDSVGGGELRAVLAQCWSALETGDRGWSDFVALDACEKIAPDSEEQSSRFTSAAIDAVDIACNMLEFLKVGEVQSLVDSVTARIDTVELFIQNNSTVGKGTELEERVASHPLMQEELRLLNEDLDLLEACVDTRHAVFAVAVERTGQRDYWQLRLKR
ncbi:DUF416 family protein [Rhodanobacter glycinis]|uniref:DUF416 family protein n=1 Tax=Rhodanobacter glycinis TaxID=582702 RepID=A0A502C0Q5_9GAMM|nr:DUF416 family protein [Rhodanobacter glycinis]TPG05346.1 DUF416 family protein [Rhodanobacter glycinis]